MWWEQKAWQICSYAAIDNIPVRLLASQSQINSVNGNLGRNMIGTRFKLIGIEFRWSSGVATSQIRTTDTGSSLSGCPKKNKTKRGAGKLGKKLGTTGVEPSGAGCWFSLVDQVNISGDVYWPANGPWWRRFYHRTAADHSQTRHHNFMPRRFVVADSLYGFHFDSNRLPFVIGDVL